MLKQLFIFFLASLCAMSGRSLSTSQSPSDPSIENSIARSLRSGDPIELSSTLRDLAPLARNFVKGKVSKLNESQRKLLCSTCRGGVNTFLQLAKTRGFDKAAKDLIKTVCPTLGILNVFPKKICESTISVFRPEVKFLFENDKLQGNKMCALILGSKCMDSLSFKNWTVDLSSTGSKPSSQEKPLSEFPKKSGRILQITDVHLDLEYTVGAKSKCKDPLCCRKESGIPMKPGNAARKWGDPNCDLPFWTFEKMLKHIKESNPEGFEYIFLTGDNTAHNIWSQSRSENMNYSRTVFDLMKNTFPEERVFPIVGNHETFPVNSFPPGNLKSPEFEPSWLYKGLANLSSHWLSKEALSTFSVFGHYSELLLPGFRVIVINSNVCSNLNFWLNYEEEDLGGQLKWLIETLLQAERNNEKVHLLSHIPPGSEECYGDWGREYSRIVNRFSNTIIAQFYGHTHMDEFVLFFDDDASQPTSLGFVTPSITTYTEMNPSYRIFTTDSSNQIIDYDTYILDLDESNDSEVTDPIFKKLYSAKRDLELDSIVPSEYFKLVQRLIKEDDFYQKYERYVVSNGTLATKKRDVICRLVTTSSYDHKICDNLMDDSE